MPLLRINATADGPRPATGTADLPLALAAALPLADADAPIVVLLLGLRFSPTDRANDPHGHIYALRPSFRCWKAVSWPRHLGFGRGRADEGLCLPFAWDGVADVGRGYRAAGQAGDHLAQVLDLLHVLAPGRPVHIVAHSLGARVALRALSRTRGTVGRVILITPAEFHRAAAAAMASPAGRRAEVIQIDAAENRVFDLAFRALAGAAGERPLGLRPVEAPNWLRLSISEPGHLAHLARLGYRIAPPRNRVCHWSGYLRPGVFGLYRALLRRPAETPLALLRPPVPARRRRLPGLPTAPHRAA